MNLYLVRHGIAIDRDDPDCPPDAERTLTSKGELRTRQAAAGLRVLGAQPELILSSRLRRAVQTAEIVADELGYPRDRIEHTAALDLDADPEELFSYLRGRPEKVILCCGHAPNLDWILSASLAELDRIDPLKKCGSACIEFDTEWGRSGTLRWCHKPRKLRRLGEPTRPVGETS